MLRCIGEGAGQCSRRAGGSVLGVGTEGGGGAAADDSIARRAHLLFDRAEGLAPRSGTALPFTQAGPAPLGPRSVMV